MTGVQTEPVNSDAPRPVIHASYELVHRTWVIRAHVSDDVQVVAAASHLTDVESAIRDQIAHAAQVLPQSFDIHLTHVLRAEPFGTSSEQSSLLTAAEVADLLHVHVKSVYHWASTGRLNSIRLPSGRRMFSVADVRRAIGGSESTVPDTVSTAATADNSALPSPRDYRWFIASPEPEMPEGSRI